jgi:hypothetical protein
VPLVTAGPAPVVVVVGPALDEVAPLVEVGPPVTGPTVVGVPVVRFDVAPPIPSGSTVCVLSLLQAARLRNGRMEATRRVLYVMAGFLEEVRRGVKRTGAWQRSI